MINFALEHSLIILLDLTSIAEEKPTKSTRNGTKAVKTSFAADQFPYHTGLVKLNLQTSEIGFPVDIPIGASA